MPLRRTLATAGREADVEAPRSHADGPSGQEMPRLVNEDQEPEPEDRDEDAHRPITG